MSQATPRRALRWSITVPTLMTLALLAACGDSGGIDNGGDNSGIPTSSVDEFSTWAASRTTDDSAEPFDIENLRPPTSDSSEPIGLS